MMGYTGESRMMGKNFFRWLSVYTGEKEDRKKEGP